MKIQLKLRPKPPQAPTKRSTKKYSIRANLSVFELPKAKSALRLDIYRRKEKIGTIDLGRGSIYWWGKNRKVAKRISWGDFADLMEKQ